MQKKEPIVAVLKENQNVFREDFELKSLTLFGSYARDEQQEDSDLDLYFELEEEQKDRKSTRLNSSHRNTSRMPSSA